jgi:4,5-DOPA dioxygenase extradiol
MNWNLADAGFDWAQRFDEDAKTLMTQTPTDVTRLDAHRDFRHAVPTPDHFIPLLYLAGLADATGQGTDVLVDGYTYGSLSMTAYTLDHTIRQRETETPQGSPPLALDVPPDESNI